MAKERLIRIVHGSFGRATVHQAGGPLVAHAHAEFHLIFKLGGADADFRIDGKPYALRDRRALLINPWLTHAKSARDDGAPSLLLALLLEPKWLGDTLGIGNPGVEVRLREIDAQMDADTIARVEALGSSLARDASDDSADYEATISELVRGMSELHIQRRSMTEALATSRPLDYRVRRAAEYIRSHAWENPNVETIANAVGMSRSRLFDQFKACMGVSPQQYLDWVRVGIATRLLTERTASIGDVAHQLGFSAQSHFTRFFVQHLGLSPSEFRRIGTPGRRA